MLPSSSSSERTLLTYPHPGYTRLWIYGSLAVLAYAYLRFAPREWLNPKDQHPGPQGVMPFAWWILVPVCIMGFSAFLAIFEGLFLIGRKRDQTTLEFDRDNFHIFARNQPAFLNFRNLVKEKNPDVQQKNWATSLDGLIRWFRGRNS